MKNRFMIFISFAAMGALYFHFRCAEIGFGDAVGFLIGMNRGFDLATNATSHLLYVNLLHLLLVTCPFASDLTLGLFFSIVFALLTLIVLYRAMRSSGVSETAALVSCLVFGFSFTFWRHAGIVEVYTFNGFAFMLALLLILKDLQSRTGRYVYGVSALMGVLMWIHVQNILLLPAFAYYLFRSGRKRLLPATLYLLFFSVLFILPAFTGLNDFRSVFFDGPANQERILSQLVFSAPKGLLKGLGYFLYNFLLFSVFMVHGLFMLYRKDRPLLIFLLLAGAPFFLFASFYPVPDSYVFFLSAYQVLMIAGALSLDSRMNRLGKWAILLAISMPLVYFAAWRTAASVPSMARFEESRAYKGGFKYMLFPGMRGNPGVLGLSKSIRDTGQKPLFFEEWEWNYRLALEYLALKEKQPLK